MPFWKKSEDPWDKKDGASKPPKPPKEPRENPVDSLKQWNEDRRAAAKEKEEAKRLPPEPCPWCGREMEQGYLLTKEGPVRWCPGIYKFTLFHGLDPDAIRIDTQGDFIMYRTTWLCRDCKKAVFDMPEPGEDVWSMDRYRYGGPQAPQETKEEEESEE